MKYKLGFIPIAYVIVIGISTVATFYFAKGGEVITRSYVTKVNMNNCTNCTVSVTTNRLDVSGSGGISIPVTGGGGGGK